MSKRGNAIAHSDNSKLAPRPKKRAFELLHWSSKRGALLIYIYIYLSMILTWALRRRQRGERGAPMHCQPPSLQQCSVHFHCCCFQLKKILSSFFTVQIARMEKISDNMRSRDWPDGGPMKKGQQRVERVAPPVWSPHKLPSVPHRFYYAYINNIYIRVAAAGITTDYTSRAKFRKAWHHSDVTICFFFLIGGANFK